MPPKGITKIAVFLDFKITICVASETDVLFTRKMYVKARTICLYGLLNVKSVIEVMEEQIVKKTMCIFVRGYKETIILPAKPEASVVEIFSDGLIDKVVSFYEKQNFELHSFPALCFFGFALIHKTPIKFLYFVSSIKIAGGTDPKTG